MIMLNRFMRIILLSCLIPLLVTAAEIPDYRLKDLQGTEHRVSDLRGKWLVINFWATWCSPCLAEMPELERFYQTHKASAEVWGVTFEDTSKENIIKFSRQLGISYPILGYAQDPLTGYGQVTVLPTTFIIDPQGLFFHRFEGPITSQDIVDVIPDLAE